jgi:phytoene desaturase
MTKKSVVIIGAGIGGLTTAALLAKDGYSVAIYESANQVGGRAGQSIVDGFTFDTGPSWYLMPSVFERTYRLLGSSVETELELIKLSPAYKVFYEHDDPITITGDESTDEATFEAIEKGAGNALRRYVDAGNEIYQLSLKHFLYTNFSRPYELLKPDILRHGPRMLKLAVTPVHRYVAQYVSDKRLQQILEYPMVFLGSSPFSAPAIYSLMSALDFREGVYYPKGGLYTIIQSLERLAVDAGVSIHLSSNVKNIITSNKKATGITLSNGKKVAADIVISNADIHHTETSLLSPADQSYPESYWQKTEPGVSALLMYLGIRGELPELEHHNLLFVDEWQKNFTDIYDDKVLPSSASMYVCKPSASDTVAPDGHENVFVLVPLPTGIEPSSKEQETLAEQYLQQLADMTGVDDLQSRIVYRRLFGPKDFITRFHAYQASALGSSHLLRQSALFRTPNRSKN